MPKTRNAALKKRHPKRKNKKLNKTKKNNKKCGILDNRNQVIRGGVGEEYIDLNSPPSEKKKTPPVYVDVCSIQ